MTETALGTPGNPKSDNLPHSSQTTQDTPITQASEHEASNDTHVVYTPDIDEARGYYDPSCASRFHGFFSNPDRRNADYAKLSREIHAEFDQMIETVRHNAWEEGHERGWMDAMESVQSDTMTSRLLAGMTPNPYENYETKETK